MGNRKLIRKIGRLFLNLQRQETGILHFKAIVVDNGYSTFSHLVSCINNLRGSLNNLNITVVTTPQRVEFIRNQFKGLEIYVAQRRYVPKRFRIAFEFLLSTRKHFDFVVLLGADIISILTALVFVRKRLYIYHPQHKWSLIRRKTVNEHLRNIPILILNIFVFIYLLFAITFLFLKRPLVLKKK